MGKKKKKIWLCLAYGNYSLPSSKGVEQNALHKEFGGKACFLFSFRSRRENRWPCVIYGAYFDESDHGPGFSVAGYSAAYDSWLHLDWAWRELLVRWNLQYYKASESENGLGEFAQYRDNPQDQRSPLKPHERAKLREIKAEFIDAICKHHDDLQGYGAAVVVKDFEKIIAEDEIARRIFLDKPYYLAAQLCLVAAAIPVRDANTRRSGNDKIELRPIFDSHEEYSGIAKKVFDNFAEKNPLSAKVLLQPAHDDDIKNTALQVSDSLAYEVRKELTRKIKDPEDDYMRIPLLRLKPAIYRVFKLDYKNLKVIAAHRIPDTIPIPHLMPEEMW
jgi:hypothetical protein